MDEFYVSDVLAGRASLRERARAAFDAKKAADRAALEQRRGELEAAIFEWLREECGVTDAELVDMPDITWSKYNSQTDQAEFKLDNIPFRARFERMGGNDKLRMESKKPSGSWEKVETLEQLGGFV